MATTLEGLEQRLVEVEQELQRLRLSVEPTDSDDAAAQRGARLLEQARREKPQLQRAVAKVFERMGIRGEPVPAEVLREMMLECGVKPEDNILSRGIIEMREE